MQCTAGMAWTSLQLLRPGHALADFRYWIYIVVLATLALGGRAACRTLMLILR